MLMLMMFVLSLGGAWALARSRATPSSTAGGSPSSRPQGTPLFKHVQIDDLSFSLPPGWQQQKDRESLVAQGDSPGQAVTWVDAAQPTRRLSVTRTAVSPQTNPAQVLQSAVITFLGAKQAQALKMIKQPLGLRFPTFVAMEVAGVTIDESGQQIEPHLVSVFSPDQEHYWVFYLTDRIPYESGKEMEAFARSAVAKDDQLMLEILRSVSLQQKP